MKKIVTVIGARPQFIKAAPLSKELRKYFNEIIVHTGQHYDYGMSEVFFKELDIPEPDHNLNINGFSHGRMTGEMLSAIEQILIEEKPDLVIVYGDTNSTLAGALAAVKLYIPIAHIEAGLRSYNRKMPEEINRVLTDQISTWLFVPSEVARINLEKEGIKKGIHVVGDIMYDAILHNSKRAKDYSRTKKELSLENMNYLLATIHRQENTDDENRLNNIFKIFSLVRERVILPLHPRTRNKLIEYNIKVPDNVLLIEPVGYLDMIDLMQNSFAILTDSGGVQKEAYYLNVPCITFRDESEWVETVEVGWNYIVGADERKFMDAYKKIHNARNLEHPILYGDGRTAEKIVSILKETL